MNRLNKEKTTSFSQILRKFGQFIYLSIQGSLENNLWENASSCSFNFIFSFVPVVMIIFTALVTFLRVSSDMLQYVYGFCKQVEPIYDFWSLLENLLNKKSIGAFNFILALWVIWMARKLFTSIIRGMYRIFRSESPRKTIANQLLTFISEFVLVIVFILFIIISFSLNKLFNLSIFDTLDSIIPHIPKVISSSLVSYALYLMFFVFSLLTYRFISGTKPAFKLCMFYAFLDTAITFVASFLLNKFMNLSNYNVIYGTISTVIVLLFKVYLFFAVFLFCAQMVYVSQFFDNLTIAQLYIIQNQKNSVIEKFLGNHLFNTPSISNAKIKTIHYNAGDVLYKKGDKSKYVYYIIKGQILENNESISRTYCNGSFLGEMTGFLNKSRDTQATVTQPTEVIRFNISSFFQIINQDHKASSVALTKLNDYTRLEDTLSE